MTQPFKTQHPEIDELFDRYRRAPQSTLFAPLADACRKAGMIEEALEICRKGLAANPRYASGYVVQGKCLYDADNPEGAEAAFHRVLEFDPDNLVALKFIGIILSERGDTGAARACFEHILALDPEDRDIRRRLQEVGQWRTVKDHTKSDEDLAGESAAAPRARTSRSAADGGDEFEGAAINLGDDGGASDEIATMTLAEIYATQGYTEKALRIYREVHRRQPDNEELTRRIASLESGAGTAPVEDVVDVKPAPARADVPSDPGTATPPTPADAVRGTGGRIDEVRSYEQFKRWLRNVSG